MSNNPIVPLLSLSVNSSKEEEKFILILFLIGLESLSLITSGEKKVR